MLSPQSQQDKSNNDDILKLPCRGSVEPQLWQRLARSSEISQNSSSHVTWPRISSFWVEICRLQNWKWDSRGAPKQNDKELIFSVISLIQKLQRGLNQLSAAYSVTQLCARSLHSRIHNPIKQWRGAECVSTHRCFTWKCSGVHMMTAIFKIHWAVRKCIITFIFQGYRLEATYDSSPRHCCPSNHHHHHISTGSGCIVRSCTETAQFHTPTPYEFLCRQRQVDNTLFGTFIDCNVNM